MGMAWARDRSGEDGVREVVGRGKEKDEISYESQVGSRVSTGRTTYVWGTWNQLIVIGGFSAPYRSFPPVLRLLCVRSAEGARENGPRKWEGKVTWENENLDGLVDLHYEVHNMYDLKTCEWLGWLSARRCVRQVGVVLLILCGLKHLDGLPRQQDKEDPANALGLIRNRSPVMGGCLRCLFAPGAVQLVGHRALVLLCVFVRAHRSELLGISSNNIKHATFSRHTSIRAYFVRNIFFYGCVYSRLHTYVMSVGVP